MPCRFFGHNLKLGEISYVLGPRKPGETGVSSKRLQTGEANLRPSTTLAVGSVDSSPCDFGPPVSSTDRSLPHEANRTRWSGPRQRLDFGFLPPLRTMRAHPRVSAGRPGAAGTTRPVAAANSGVGPPGLWDAMAVEGVFDPTLAKGADRAQNRGCKKTCRPIAE